MAEAEARRISCSLADPHHISAYKLGRQIGSSSLISNPTYTSTTGILHVDPKRSPIIPLTNFSRSQIRGCRILGCRVPGVPGAVLVQHAKPIGITVQPEGHLGFARGDTGGGFSHAFCIGLGRLVAEERASLAPRRLLYLRLCSLIVARATTNEPALT